ncbi:MAG: thiamine pyrophosphate-dependent enzyme [Candidatus Peribacteraceae bacterium]|nr:thiamine pyrophosphate-dependent enzyme [Candidatus Peribacteraceae bacterium]
MKKIPLSASGPQMKDFVSSAAPTWCEGCGNYGIWSALKQVLVELKLQPWQVLLCFDVGCHGNMADKLLGYRIHGLHGRVIPLAAGAKLANPGLPVIAVGGDGASFSEGVGHLVHAVRSNYPITLLMHNNANYGLTTGQASALTKKGERMNSSPNGIPEETLNSMDFVFSLKPTFVARAFSGNVPQMVQIMKAAITHRGFAYVDILQACPSYNHFATQEWLEEHCYSVQESKKKYDTSDFDLARKTAVDTSKKIATGILYQAKAVPDFIERLQPRKNRKTTPVEEVAITDISRWMERFI